METQIVQRGFGEHGSTGHFSAGMDLSGRIGGTKALWRPPVSAAHAAMRLKDGRYARIRLATALLARPSVA